MIASAVVVAASTILVSVVAPFVAVPIASISSSAISAVGIATSVGTITFGLGAVASIVCNISAINESEKLIKKYSGVEPMSDERYDAINSTNTKYDIGNNPSGDTSNLGIIDSIAYIRKVREKSQFIAENWTEEEMLRELQYHQRGYYWSEFLGNPFGLSDNLIKVDFEEEQTIKTYLRRIIGNCIW